MPRIVLLAVVASALLAQPAAAATINVQNHHDAGNGSLRKAIADANPNDEILVPPGTYKLTSGDLDVGINLTIAGAGSGTGPASNTIIDAGGKSRVFNVHDGEVTLKDMRVTGGAATQGAGAYVTSTLDLDGVALVGNVATGAMGARGEGGGIFLAGPKLSVVNSSVAGNQAKGGTAGGFGGGIEVRFGNGGNSSVTIDRSTVAANIAGDGDGGGLGGGIMADTESNNATFNMTVAQSTIAGNVATPGPGLGLGGGIDAGSGGNNGSFTIGIDRSTVSGNRAGGIGGGVSFASGGTSDDETFTVTNSTVAGNTAPVDAGISFGGSGSGTKTSTFTHATIAGNHGTGIETPSGTATLRNSIIAGNTGANCDGTMGSTSHDIEDTDTCGLDPMNGDKPNTDPKLNPLGDYGGPTRTMLPRADSPALNAAESLYCTPLGIDQRGVIRPQGPECDIGAVEAQIADVALTGTRTPKTVSAGKVVTYRFTARDKGPQVAQGVKLIDRLPAKLKLVSVAGCSGRLGAGCTIGTIPFGATRTVTIKARARRSGRVTNAGRVTTFAADPMPGNDRAATTVTILPSLTRLSMKPKTWSLGGTTTIRFKLSDPGQVTLSFARKGKDGKFRKVGSRKLTRKRGRNRLSFDGKLDGGKVLSAGSYRLTARVEDAAGRRSTPARLTFKLTS